MNTKQDVTEVDNQLLTRRLEELAKYLDRLPVMTLREKLVHAEQWTQLENDETNKVIGKVIHALHPWGF